MKKTIIIVMLISSLFLLCACESSSGYKEKDPFVLYLLDKGYIVFEDGDYSPIELPSGFSVNVDTYYTVDNTVAKDKSGNHVVLTAYCKNSSAAYSWVTTCSIDDRKKDLAALGDYAIEYAKAMNWDNKYDLYINLASVTGSCDIVYNYETNTIFISKYEDLWIDAYQKFGTWELYDLKTMPNAQDWLIQNNFGQMKHGEFEMFSSTSYYEKDESYNVRIYDGEFKEYARDHSNSY